MKRILRTLGAIIITEVVSTPFIIFDISIMSIVTDSGRKLLALNNINTLLTVTLAFAILSILALIPCIAVYSFIGEDRFKTYLSKTMYAAYVIIMEILLFVYIVSSLTKI